MRKVNEELTEIVGVDSLVEESHLPKLHYLDAVIKETFCLHPVLPLLVTRCPSQSTTTGGHCVPKGTRVFLNVWAIHRDPKIWKNPLEFQPERFLISDPTKLDYSANNFNYIPFGSGRRICAGLPLAERSVMYVVASFLYSYDRVEVATGQGTELDSSDKFGIVTKKMKPTPRLSKFELYTE
jgi:cytochrome P450